MVAIRLLEPYCPRCNRTLGVGQSLRSHQRPKGTQNFCCKCSKDFASPDCLTQHFVQSPRHAYCQRCALHFPSGGKLIEHLHLAHYCCDACRAGPPAAVENESGERVALPRVFASERGLHEHRRLKHADRYCVPCERMFSSAGNYDSHRRSALHQGRRVECPMEDCGKHFVSIAAVYIHLESGACVSGVTADDVARIAASVDRYDNVITVDDARWIADQVYDPLDRGSGWSGPSYECPICDDEVPTSSRALRQHIRSVHPIFHCPPDFGCGKRFGTLSALCQHVESGQCDVCDERDEVDRVVDDVLRELEA